MRPVLHRGFCPKGVRTLYEINMWDAFHLWIWLPASLQIHFPTSSSRRKELQYKFLWSMFRKTTIVVTIMWPSEHMIPTRRLLKYTSKEWKDRFVNLQRQTPAKNTSVIHLHHSTKCTASTRIYVGQNFIDGSAWYSFLLLLTPGHFLQLPADSWLFLWVGDLIFCVVDNPLLHEHLCKEW